MSSTYMEVHYHVRSISLPSRLQLHPSSNDLETELKKIFEGSIIDKGRSLQASDINEDLTRLVNLYNCVKDLIDLPLTQKGLLHQEEKNHLENALDLSILLLDVCGSARELMLLMKENVQDLQSSMRRKGLDSSSIKGQICAYICSRKRARKEISKILKSLKTMENSGFKSHYLLLDNKVNKVLRELSVVTILFLRKVLFFMCPQLLKKNNNVSGRWSLFSRIVSIGSDRENNSRVMNEIEEIDIYLWSLDRSIRKINGNNKDDVQKVVKRRLEELDGGIRELEAGLGCLFRCLIQQRVSLLNLLTPR